MDVRESFKDLSPITGHPSNVHLYWDSFTNIRIEDGDGSTLNINNGDEVDILHTIHRRCFSSNHAGTSYITSYSRLRIGCSCFYDCACRVYSLTSYTDDIKEYQIIADNSYSLLGQTQGAYYNLQRQNENLYQIGNNFSNSRSQQAFTYSILKGKHNRFKQNTFVGTSSGLGYEMMGKDPEIEEDNIVNNSVISSAHQQLFYRPVKAIHCIIIENKFKTIGNVTLVECLFKDNEFETLFSAEEAMTRPFTHTHKHQRDWECKTNPGDCKLRTFFFSGSRFVEKIAILSFVFLD